MKPAGKTFSYASAAAAISPASSTNGGVTGVSVAANNGGGHATTSTTASTSSTNTASTNPNTSNTGTNQHAQSPAQPTASRPGSANAGPSAFALNANANASASASVSANLKSPAASAPPSPIAAPPFVPPQVAMALQQQQQQQQFAQQLQQHQQRSRSQSPVASPASRTPYTYPPQQQQQQAGYNVGVSPPESQRSGSPSFVYQVALNDQFNNLSLANKHGHGGYNMGGGRYTPDPIGNTGNNLEALAGDDDEDDLVLSRKRNIRTRTASTPNALMGVVPPSSTFYDYSGFLNVNNPADALPKQYRSLSFSLDVATQQQQLQQMQQQQHQQQLPQPDLQRRPSFVHEDSNSPGFGQPQRSRTPLLGVVDPQQQQQQLHALHSHHHQTPDLDSDFGFQTAGRSRSKSSGAAYGIPDSYMTPGSGPAGSPGTAFDPMNSIWSTSANDSGVSSILHRRSSTQPSVIDSSRWGSGPEGNNGAGGVTSVGSGVREPLRGGDDDGFGMGLGAAGPSDLDKYRRRHSHAPNLYADLAAQMIMQPNDQSDLYDTRRRHSLAGPPLYKNYLNDMDALYDVKGDVPLFEEINDYFENTEHRTKAWVEAGKNLQKQSSYTQQYWPVYVIEFKAGRIDYFHAAECIPGQIIRNGDLVIVEADRGKDLGKVVHDNLANLAQLHMFQSQHKDIMVESLISSKEIQPKRIYGLAQQNEVALLVSKAQDEAKAMAVCQAKIRQRKLPMEIVDAEYQWDRKKLTFYFVADRRVDFRELIRDLFKLYKTRIWMCAVDPSKMPRPY
ncbi:hypothetical protein HDU99_000698 [Rhizoclosmatium hyalinum]|nr:hypothetical protein HDU99_000698 [Rhizoclosmatium hyalinum]